MNLHFDILSLFEKMMGNVNPEVRTCGYIGIDDFAKWKGHKYMCVIAEKNHRERVIPINLSSG